MNKKQVLATAFVAVLLFSALVGMCFVNLASANFFPIPTPLPAIFIRSDGSVDPLTAPIQRAGDVYTFTNDIIGYTIAVERDNIVIDGGGYTLQGNGNSTGIFLKNRNHVTVRNMEIRNFSYGIRLIAEAYMGMSSKSNILSGNTVTNNTYGIYISSSSKNVLSGNTVTNNTYGIYIGSSSNVLRNNHMNNNKYSFSVYGTTLSNSINDVDVTNTIDSKPIYYWINQQNKAVPSDAGYIALVNCTGMTVQNFDLVNNGQGILLVATTNSIMTKNRIANNGNGIWLAASSNNSISENIITNNGYDAVYVYNSTNNNIIANTIANNGRGAIRLLTGSYNNISENTITNNGEGINLEGSHSNNINANIITNNNGTGIDFFGSGNVNITGNTITGNNDWGIKFCSSSSKVISNYIANNSQGISVEDSQHNRIINNTVTENNGWGIQIKSGGLGPPSSRDNIIHHNNFIDNKAEGLQVSIPGIWSYPGGWIPGLGNVWDDGKEGNYWSDYVTRYPNATEIPGAGIWDNPYFINENNIDRCPLMEPVAIPPITIPEFPDEENPTTPPDGSNGQTNLDPTPLLMAVPIVLAIILGLAFYRRKKSVIRQTPISNNACAPINWVRV